jgi:hypothetical protein
VRIAARRNQTAEISQILSGAVRPGQIAAAAAGGGGSVHYVGGVHLAQQCGVSATIWRAVESFCHYTVRVSKSLDIERENDTSGT